MTEIITSTRRDFIKIGAVIGGGLLIGCSLPDSLAKAAKGDGTDDFVPNAFIKITPNEQVTVYINKAEMGQGVYTSLPMLIAEELEVDWSRVRAEPAPVEPAYNHTWYGPYMVTGGSTSVRSEWDRLRTMGAMARLMLINAAAGLWKVDPQTCRAENGQVIDKDGRRRLSYGKLTKAAAGMVPPPEIPLKKPDEFKVLGKSRARLDIPDKSRGKAIFAIDVTVPGMLVAVVARPPIFGATIKSFDKSKTMKISGVKAVIPIERGIGVVADGFWNATRGRDALKVEWDEGPLAGIDSETQGREYAKMAEPPGLLATKRGDVAKALDKAVKKLEAVYELPYLAHAPMEPLNCVADVRPDGCDIWTGSQMQTTDRNKAAAITGLPPEKVLLHNTMLGCGFGRRATPDSHLVSEAVELSFKMKAPIKVSWTRADDLHGGYYRPRSYHRLQAAIGEDGLPVAWQHRIVGQSIARGTLFEKGLTHNGIDETSVEGEADSPYEIDNFQVECHMAPAGIPVLWWRSVGHSYNGYVKECFIDELANLAGQDPYQYRRKLLAKHPRELGVLDLAAEKAGWGGKLPEGRGRGIAMHASFGSYVAQVAEISLDNGAIRVHKVTCAIDCGMTVNPDTIEAQMQSGIVFGLSAALYDEITFTKGRVNQDNFDSYEMLRMDAMPEISVHILPSKELPGGVGEPGVPPIAPAVANAVRALTGVALRRLPLTPDRVQKALQAA